MEKKVLHKRLDAYSRQAKSIKANNVKKYAALVATPLAALPMAALGQCGTATVNMMTNFMGSTSASLINIDIDGDLTPDFQINAAGAPTSILFVTLNAAVFDVATSGGIVAYVPFGADVQAYGFGGGGGVLYSTAGAFNWAPGLSGYIGVLNTVTGDYGFIELSIAAGTGVVTVTGSGTGMDTDGGTTLAGDCSTLPVELTNFTAKTVDNKIVLAWETASEETNSGFELQRSTDGKSFQKLGWVDGHGTTLEAQKYSFKDEKVSANTTYYYRLKQVDIDGSFTYSDVVKAAMIDGGKVVVSNVFPNPVNKDAQVNIAVAAQSEALVHLFDATGKQLQTTKVELAAGENTVTLDVQDLAKGIYFAKIESGTESVYRKIVKE